MDSLRSIAIGCCIVVVILAGCGDNPARKYSSLGEAIRARDLEAVRYLVDKGVDVNKYDPASEPHHLIYAVVMNNVALTEILLQAGADTEATLPADFMERLIDAAQSGDKDARLWIRRHEDTGSISDFANSDAFEIHKQSTSQITALWSAASKGQTKMVRLLLEYDANTEARGTAGTTPLHAAAQQGHEEIITLLIDAGATINALSDEGGTPLTWAAGENQLGSVRILLAAGADPLFHGDNSQSPADWAAANGHSEVLKVLFENGVDINQGGLLGMTPLHHAAMNRHTELVQWLLESGANVNAQDTRHVSTLHAAAYGGDIDIIRLLIDNGVEPSVKNDAGHTAADLARRRGHEEIAKFLESLPIN